MTDIFQKIQKDIDSNSEEYQLARLTVSSSICVKKWLKANDKKQSWLAEQLEVSEPRVSLVLSGVDPWSITTFLKLRKITGLDLIEFPLFKDILVDKNYKVVVNNTTKPVAIISSENFQDSSKATYSETGAANRKDDIQVEELETDL